MFKEPPSQKKSTNFKIILNLLWQFHDNIFPTLVKLISYFASNSSSLHFYINMCHYQHTTSRVEWKRQRKLTYFFMRILLNNFCQKKNVFWVFGKQDFVTIKKHSHLPNQPILFLLTTKTCLSIKNKNVCTIKNCSVKSLEIIFCVILMSISCFLSADNFCQQFSRCYFSIYTSSSSSSSFEQCC